MEIKSNNIEPELNDSLVDSNSEFIKTLEKYQKEDNAKIKQFEETLNRQILTLKELKENENLASNNVLLTGEEAEIFEFFKQHKNHCYTAYSFACKFYDWNYYYLQHEVYGIEQLLMRMVEKGSLKGAAYKGYYFYYFE